MNKALLHHVSMGLIGCSFAMLSLPDLVAGDSSISLGLFAISGVGLVLTSLYSLFDGPDDFEPNQFTPLVVVGAVLSVLGAGISLLG